MSRLQGSVALVNVVRPNLLCDTMSPDLDPGDPGGGLSQVFIRPLMAGYNGQGGLKHARPVAIPISHPKNDTIAIGLKIHTASIVFEIQDFKFCVRTLNQTSDR